MLNKPAIFKVPKVTGQIGSGQVNGCSYFHGKRDYPCSPYNGSCIDSTYESDSCSAGLAITAVGSVAAVAAIAAT